MTDEASARLGLPYLQPGQAQKELYHNEALALIDLVVHAGVIAIGVNTPPSAPVPGDCWVVGSAPDGAWSGRADMIAGWTQGGWRFVAPKSGMTVWSIADQLVARFIDGVWDIGNERATRLTIGGNQVVGAREAAIAAPSGGGVADTEARAAVSAILVALRNHGLIAG